jgi:2,3-diaminopropionate biosynthesis protein SbnA
MIISNLTDIKAQPLFYHLQSAVEDADVYLKIEGLNIAGSIKLKTALYLINKIDGGKPDKINPRYIIESSSGNLGVALSIVCKQRGYSFICVTDPNISPANEKYIKLFGGKIIKVNEKDDAGGYLSTRINFIKKFIKENPDYFWTNQYANDGNPNAHYFETAREIHSQFTHVDYLFIGAGTTGTLMGCAKYFKSHLPATRIIAVDTVGSVTFNQPPSKRYVPGIGTSKRPAIVNEEFIDDLVMVHEIEAIKMCHEYLSRYGLFLGGSTGSVLSAVHRYTKYKSDHKTIVAISPDFGNNYQDTVYNHIWLQQVFPTVQWNFE